MTLTAANPGGWSLNEVLTSAQMTFLQNELLKAIDGVNGGTYTLGGVLQYEGADVRFGSDVDFLSGSAVAFASGSTLSIVNGVTGTIDGDIDFGANSDTRLLSGANLTGLAGSLVDVLGELRIGSGGILNVESGGRLDINTGSEMNVEGTGFIRVGGEIQLTATGDLDVESGGNINLLSGGDINVLNGGNIVLLSGADLVVQAGADITLEDAGDLVIDDDNETFRTMLIPHELDVGWSRSTHASGKLTWEQVDVAAQRNLIFPLPVRPGDSLVNVFVALNGENGHGGFPTNMPRAEIIRVAIDGSFTTLAVKTDPSASLGAYESNHYVILENGSLDSGAMPILGTSDPLYVVVFGEFGGPAIVGLEITSITGNVTARSYRTNEGVYT